MGTIKVSVIVPIYNAEKYLEKSLLSLSRQTLDGIEIILVNDGSTDNSLDIITAFKTVFPDKFIAVNSERNRGPGGARNIGISYARGEYIGFVDCDDVADERMFEILYVKAKEKNSDLVMCAYKYGGKLGELRNSVLGLSPEERGELIAYTGFLWHSIFKKSVLLNMGQLFREKYAFQDIDFLCEVYCRIESIDFVHNVLYEYVNNADSITHKDNDVEKCSTIARNCMQAVRERCQGTPYGAEVSDAIDFVIIKTSMPLLMSIIEQDELMFENVKAFNKLLMELVPNYLENRYLIKNGNSVPMAAVCSYDDDRFYQNILSLKREIKKGKL